MDRCVRAATLVGGRAAAVHAIDDDAIRFWTRRGFKASQSSPYLLYRSIGDIVASLSK